jgi:predicted DNA-binding transcriptional regulator AlpA
MIYLLESRQRFPARTKISARAVGWIEDEVMQWIAEKKSCRPISRKS